MRKFTFLIFILLFSWQLSFAQKVTPGLGTGMGIPILVVENGNGPQISIQDGFHQKVNNDNYLNYYL